MIEVAENKKYKLSISFGMANYKLDGSYTLEDLVKKADHYMYENKKLKKACR